MKEEEKEVFYAAVDIISPIKSHYVSVDSNILPIIAILRLKVKCERSTSNDHKKKKNSTDIRKYNNDD